LKKGRIFDIIYIDYKTTQEDKEMSHRSQVTTQIKNLDILKKAIKEMGLSYFEGQELVGSYTRGWSAADKKADLILGIDGRKDIGFKKNASGTYDMVGDFYGLRMGEKSLKDKVLQMYNLTFVKDAIANNSSYGITSYTTNTLANGDIVLEGEVDTEQVIVA